MKKFSLKITPQDILAVCGGDYRGEDNLVLSSVTDPTEADNGSIVFYEQVKYMPAVQSSTAGLVFCTPEGAPSLPGRNLLLHPKPYFALMRLLSWWLEKCSDKPQPGIHSTAVVDPATQLGGNIHLGINTVIGKNAILGDGVIIEANCVIGDNVSIGKGTRLYPNVVIYPDCIIGKDATIHSGTVIGADGFGYVLLDGIQHKIPQVGNVRIEDHVEIGANTTIDRGTLGSTFIGEGTKIDNLVQIGHNCRIGKHSILCAQVGLAGSTIVGDYVYLAGQAAAAGHLTIGDRTMVGGQAGVTSDTPPDARLWGTPASDIARLKRVIASQKHLPEMYHYYLKQIKKDGEKD